LKALFEEGLEKGPSQAGKFVFAQIGRSAQKYDACNYSHARNFSQHPNAGYKSTLEFRVFDPTLNSNQAFWNMVLCSSIVEYAIQLPFERAMEIGVDSCRTPDHQNWSVFSEILEFFPEGIREEGKDHFTSQINP